MTETDLLKVLVVRLIRNQARLYGLIEVVAEKHGIDSTMLHEILNTQWQGSEGDDFMKRQTEGFAEDLAWWKAHGLDQALELRAKPPG